MLFPFVLFILSALCVGPVSCTERLYLYDRPICTGLGDRVGTMLSLAALARVENASIAYLWCKDPSVIVPAQRAFMPRWSGFNYSLDEFKSRFRPPSEIAFVDDLSGRELQGLPRVVWQGLPFPAEQGSDSIPQNAWLTMRLPTERKLDYIDAFQSHYKSLARPMAMAQQKAGARVRRPYILLHMRGPDDNTYAGPLDGPENYCTGKVIKGLLRMKLGMPIYAITNNPGWAGYLLNGRVKLINGTGSAYDHFSLLLSAEAIIQHAWGGWSSYSSVPALVSGAPMINTYDVGLMHHRFRVFRSQLGVPPNYYDCTQAFEFMQAIQARTERAPPVPPDGANPAEFLYAPEGHRHLVSARLNDRGLAPLTRWAQGIIHANQFVRDCSQRRFTGFHGWNAGFGAEMHVMGAALGYAIEHNTTLVLGPRSCAFNRCPNGCECILAPISNCRFDESNERMHVLAGEGHQFRDLVPSVLKAALLARYPRMAEAQVLYWWRAQSSAFLARFNEETVRIVAVMRRAEAPGIPFPLPPGVINAHIRGGDKRFEMRLVPAGTYVETAVELAASMPNGFGQQHTLLIVADDERSVETGVRLGRANGLEVLHSSVKRLTNGWHQADLERVADRKARFYNDLLELLLALEADAWIGTRASNFGRLIDNLRCVWVDKCLQPFREVGGEQVLGRYNW